MLYFICSTQSLVTKLIVSLCGVDSLTVSGGECVVWQQLGSCGPTAAVAAAADSCGHWAGRLASHPVAARRPTPPPGTAHPAMAEMSIETLLQAAEYLERRERGE